MRALVLTFALLVPIFSLEAQIPPSDTQAGDFLFQMPPGWQRADQGSKTFLLPSAVSASPSTYIQLAGFDLGNNTLQAGFNAEVVGFERAYRVLSRGQTDSKHSSNGFDYYSTTLAVADSNSTQWVAAIFAAQYGNRLETLVFMTSEPQQQTRAAYLKALQDFLPTIHFGPSQGNQNPPAQSAPPASAPPSASGSMERDMSIPPAGPMSFNHLPTIPGKFNGIFRAPIPQGVDISASLNITDPSKNTPNYQYLILFSDGTAMRGLPDMGLSALKASVRLDISGGGTAAARWGIYRMTGNRGQVVFASPTAAGQQLVTGRLVGDAWNIQEFPDRLEINGNKYTMLDGGTPGMKLAGTYKPFGDRNKPGIIFTPDGEFDDQGIMKPSATAIGIAGGGLAIGYAFSSPGPGHGTYRTGSYTLNLNYSTSQSAPVLFWIDPQTPNAQVIYLGNIKFQRVK